MAAVCAAARPFASRFRTSRRQVRKRPARPRLLCENAAMKAGDYTRLELLAAIWGASFIFMRVAAPAFGTVLTAEGRLLIAGLVLAACLCYGYNGVLMRRYAADVPSRGIAVGGQLAAALMLLPLAPFSPPIGTIGAIETANLLALALFGNALGFAMYFRLISDVGATRALTVTYLMPFFGLLWGMLFLGESLPASALAGGVLIIAGTVLVTRG